MTVPLVSSFQQFVLSLAPVFTQPSFANFLTVLTGWAFCFARHTVTNIIVAAGAYRKHFSCYHRFFGRARWYPDAIGYDLLMKALEFVPDDEPVVFAVDDTLTRKTGRHIWGAAMHHDPLRSTSRRAEFSFGHSWVVLAIVVRMPFSDRYYATPVLVRLYRKKQKRRRPGRPKGERKCTGLATGGEYRTRPELAVEMLEIAAGWLNGRRIRVVADSEYSGQSVSRHLPENIDLFGRMVMNAALYAEPTPRAPGQKGRARKKGDRLPNPTQLARSRGFKWRDVRVTIYGKRVRARVKTLRALWYSSAGPRPLRIVVVRDPSGRRRDDCFFTTAVKTNAKTVLKTIAMRWSLEVAFRDMKQSLGLEDPQSRTRLAVERTAPTAMVLYSLTVMWYAHSGHTLRERWFKPRPWYRKKTAVSFDDMIATLRQASWVEVNSADPAQRVGSVKLTGERLLHMHTSLSRAS
jgi:hypothetical protein